MAKTSIPRAPRRATSACRHCWVLETPNGPKVRGTCRICRAERVFKTVPDEVATFRPHTSSLGVGGPSLDAGRDAA